MIQRLPGEAPLLRPLHMILMQPNPHFSVIALPLFSGLLFGSVLGCFSGSLSVIHILRDYFSTDAGSLSLIQVIWHSVRYLLLIAILSTSVLGVFLIPSLSFLRGFLLSGIVSAAFQAQSFRGMTLSAFSVGIPALITFPAFLLASLDGLSFSCDIAGFIRKKDSRPPDDHRHITIHVVLIIILTLLEASYTLFLLPLLLKMIR